MPQRLPPLLLLAVTLSCAHSGSPTAALTDAAKRSDAPSAPARTLALAGFHALLVNSDAPHAQERFDEALKRDPADPYPHLGKLLLAERAGHPEGTLEEALQILEQAPPQHPLQMTAAR